MTASVTPRRSARLAKDSQQIIGPLGAHLGGEDEARGIAAFQRPLDMHPPHRAARARDPGRAAGLQGRTHRRSLVGASRSQPVVPT